jgi:PAS domain S-box-containing protein
MARLNLRIVAGTDGIITDIEGDSLEMLGWEPAELVGQNVVEIIPFKYREAHDAGMTRFVADGSKKEMGSWLEVEARRRDGQVQPVTFVVTERAGVLEGLLETPSDPRLPTLDERDET